MKAWIKLVLYHSGVLSLYHRVRNKGTLTVVMFHRVLPTADPRSASSLPEWTVTDSVFGDCLGFFTKHYDVVSLEQVRSAVGGGPPLPDRSLLITFDDGYADIDEYALPVLRRHDAPAVVFMISDFIGGAGRPWQEEFFAAWSQGRISPTDVKSTFRRLRGPGDDDKSVEDMARDIAWRGPALDEERVSDLFSRLETSPVPTGLPPQMLSVPQLRELHQNHIAIGGHGRSHIALPTADDPDAELSHPVAEISRALDATGRHDIYAMSFPHGQYSADLIQQARSRGYELLFTSRPCLMRLVAGRPTGTVFGRLHVSAPGVAPRGRLRPELLALALFRAGRESKT